MKPKPRVPMLVIIILLSSVGTFAQGFSVESKTLPSVSVSDHFVSLQGKFSIALPPKQLGFQPLSFDSPSGPVSGDSYIWMMKEARFSAAYVDANQILESQTGTKDFFDRLRDNLLARAQPAQAKVTRDKETALNGHPGREMKFELSDGIFINRVYLVANRMYQVTAILKGEQINHEEKVLKVFDSFKLLSDAALDEELKRRIAEAMPSPLPQEPVISKAKSDVQDEGLKGKVHSVVHEAENLSNLGKRSRTSVEYYNPLGNLIKSESFDWKGNLSSITVYGYIDGDRVTKYGRIEREYNPPPILIAAGEADKPKPTYDSRYSAKFRYKYDDQKRQIERQTFNNSGKLTWRCVVSFTGNRKEETCYSGEKSYRKNISTLDKDGNEVERIEVNLEDGSMKNKLSFTYEFDSHGNWIKKKSSKWITKDGRSYYEPDTIYHRTITYH